MYACQSPSRRKRTAYLFTSIIITRLQDILAAYLLITTSTRYYLNLKAPDATGMRLVKIILFFLINMTPLSSFMKDRLHRLTQYS